MKELMEYTEASFVARVVVEYEKDLSHPAWSGRLSSSLVTHVAPP